MCMNCQEYNFVCRSCGTILDPEWERLQPYWIDRKGIKRIVDTSDSRNFVWFLRYAGKIVRVGFGDLHKLLNETKPSPRYIQFDSVFIYMCDSIEERNIFATYAMGNIDGVDNRRALRNNRYVSNGALRFKDVVSLDIRNYVLEDPDFLIGETKYWDVNKLRESGYVY